MYESTLLPATRNDVAPPTKIRHPQINNNTVLSDYQIVVNKDPAAGAISVTEYVQGENS